MATTTVLDLLKASAKDIGVLQPGESLSPEDAAECLDRFNDWIDALKLESLTIYTNSRVTWTITSASSYTVGSGGTVNCARPPSPNAILSGAFQDTSVTPAWEQQIPIIDEDVYQAIPIKTQTSTYPSGWYYNPTYSSALGTISPFPIPTSSTLLGVLYVPSPIDEYAALTTNLAVPPGYRRFMRTNLAVEIWPVFFPDEPVPSNLVKMANGSKDQVKGSNYRMGELSTGDAGIIFGGWPRANIYTGNPS